ncbi:transposase domain-containing protein [Streptomyces syringium]|uniref:transposase domain-containing protein n=1 Tax=Streptomyces syringium TaxID=76729 RepID=UPI0034535A71
MPLVNRVFLHGIRVRITQITVKSVSITQRQTSPDSSHDKEEVDQDVPDPLPSQFSTCTMTRTTTAAAGAFAPGHLGGLTQHIPFELVDDVLDETRTVQARVRTLPSRVGLPRPGPGTVFSPPPWDTGVCGTRKPPCDSCADVSGQSR